MVAPIALSFGSAREPVVGLGGSSAAIQYRRCLRRRADRLQDSGSSARTDVAAEQLRRTVRAFPRRDVVGAAGHQIQVARHVLQADAIAQRAAPFASLLAYERSRMSAYSPPVNACSPSTRTAAVRRRTSPSRCCCEDRHDVLRPQPRQNISNTFFVEDALVLTRVFAASPSVADEQAEVGPIGRLSRMLMNSASLRSQSLPRAASTADGGQSARAHADQVHFGLTADLAGDRHRLDDAFRVSVEPPVALFLRRLRQLTANT